MRSICRPLLTNSSAADSSAHDGAAVVAAGTATGVAGGAECVVAAGAGAQETLDNSTSPHAARNVRGEFTAEHYGIEGFSVNTRVTSV